MQVSETAPAGRSGAVRATGADPNDPALHRMSEGMSEASIKYPSRGASPKAGSFSSRVGSPRDTSFPSSSGSLVSSPQAKQQPLHEEDLFTRAVKPAKDKKEGKRENLEAEGLELGTMNSSGSIGLVDDGLAHELLDVLQSSSSAAQQGGASGGDSALGSNLAQAQPVSFQSLARLASQASRHMPDAGTDSIAATTTRHRAEDAHEAQGNSGHPGQSSSGAQPQDQPAASPSASDAATSHPDALPRINTDAQHSTSLTPSSGRSDRGQATAAAAPSLSKSGSIDQKKWAYPVPTGSPMFERVRSRNYDHEAAAASGLQEGVQTGAEQPSQDNPASPQHLGAAQNHADMRNAAR